MAGAFEQPLFFSTAMITTSSRLQHLDSHFSLHARLSSCRQTTSRPQADRIHSSPSLLLSPPPKTIKRSMSRSSTSSDDASFHTTVSNAEKEDSRGDNTACLSMNKGKTATVLENSQPEVTKATGAKAHIDTGSRHEPSLPSIPVIEPIKESPERSGATSRKERTHRALDRRRTSTISEPLPRSAIPRRTSSTVHRRQRKRQDLISFHQDSCRLFQSLEGTLSANCQGTRPIFTRHYSMPSSRSTSFDEPADPPVIQRPAESLQDHFEDPVRANGGGEIPEHVPSTVSLPVSVEIEESAPPVGPTAATVMSWTTAETRKQEYEKIDQAHRGVRGLWKKFTPKWCHSRNSRRKFFEGKCDGDSVRRYRM